MNTLVARLLTLVTAFGVDIKTINNAIGALTTLKTSTKTNLVSAINELWDKANNSTSIDDTTASTGKTYSSSKVIQLVAAGKQEVKAEILGGASAAFDTLKEIQTSIEGDETAISGLLVAVGNRVAVDQVQGFTDAQKTQGRANLAAYGAAEIGNPDTDFVAAYNQAKA